LAGAAIGIGAAAADIAAPADLEALEQAVALGAARAGTATLSAAVEVLRDAVDALPAEAETATVVVAGIGLVVQAVIRPAGRAVAVLAWVREAAVVERTHTGGGARWVRVAREAATTGLLGLDAIGAGAGGRFAGAGGEARLVELLTDTTPFTDAEGGGCRRATGSRPASLDTIVVVATAVGGDAEAR
jgi:hypothetical protein